MPRKRRKKSESIKNYFGEEQEQAVLEYRFFLRQLDNNSLSDDEYTEITLKKDNVYNTFLKDSIRIMSESILLRYFPKNKYNWGVFSMEELVNQVETHLILNMGAFNENKLNKNGDKVRAYSYFQTIIKNHYIKIFKDIDKLRKQRKNDVLVDNITDEIDTYYNVNYIEDSEEFVKLDKFIKIILDEMSDVMENNENLTSDEIKAGEAIIYLFKNWESLFMETSEYGKYDKKITNKYTKEKTLFLISEFTNMNTKEFRKNMKVYSNLYKLLKKEFYDM